MGGALPYVANGIFKRLNESNLVVAVALVELNKKRLFKSIRKVKAAIVLMIVKT